MMHNTSTLYSELNKALVENEKQIGAITKDLEKRIEALPYPGEVSVYEMKNREGKHIMVDLLVARAQILNGMASLKAADLISKKR